MRSKELICRCYSVFQPLVFFPQSLVRLSKLVDLRVHDGRLHSHATAPSAGMQNMKPALPLSMFGWSALRQGCDTVIRNGGCTMVQSLLCRKPPLKSCTRVLPIWKSIVGPLA